MDSFNETKKKKCVWGQREEMAPFDQGKLLGTSPGDAVVKNPPANAQDTGSSPGPGSSHMPRSK